MPGKGRYTSPEGSHLWEYWAAFVCSIQGFCIGLIIGWNSPTLAMLLEPDSPVPIDHNDASTIAAVAPLGHLIAPIITNRMIDSLGRKNTMFLSGLPGIISWALLCITPNLWVMIISRFLAGFALGANFCVSPLYLGEIASAKLRGAISASYGVLMNLGILFAFIIIPYMDMFLSSAVFTSICILGQIAMYFIPESPYFLMLTNRESEAESVLEKFRGKLDVSEELEVIRNSIKERKTQNQSFMKSLKLLCSVKTNLRGFIIVNLFIIPIYFGGLCSMMVYGHVIFQAAGTSISENVATISIAVTQLIASLITTCLIDRVGRKPLTLWSGILSGLCDFVIGFYFFANEYMGMDVSPYNAVPLVAAIILVFTFNIGAPSIQPVILGEILSTEVKAVGSCLCSFLAGVQATIAIKMYLIFTNTLNLGHSLPYIGCGITTFVVIATIQIITPETKGKTFTEIQQMLAK